MWAAAHRLASFAIAVLGALVLVQVLLWTAPGDPIDTIPNGELHREALEQMWHLDRPPLQRFGPWFADLLHGRLGSSLVVHPGAPVTSLLSHALGPSLWRLFSALVLCVCTALGLSLTNTGTGRRWLDMVSIAPIFLAAHVVVHGTNELTAMGLRHGWWVRPEWFALPAEAHPVRSALAVVLLAYASASLADVSADVDAAVRRIRSSGYVLAARGRGMSITGHVARNLIGPLASILTRHTSFFLGSLVILERVLLLDGLGTLLWESALLRDYPVALAATGACAIVVGLVRLSGDMVQLAIDPRQRRA